MKNKAINSQHVHIFVIFFAMNQF
ncbi:hypothetical protein ENC_04100 [Enterobacter hormaechei]|nr:hypothetical protein ENC_04100 [Enterobacter hormaechei]